MSDSSGRGDDASGLFYKIGYFPMLFEDIA